MRSLIESLGNRRVLVIGDVVLDEYLFGQASRMSREAPIPVLEYESRRLIPGGAANPAANIVSLGSAAVQVGVVGADENAFRLRKTLSERGIDGSGLIADPRRPTTLKMRVMAQMGLRFPQQVARMDTLNREPITLEIANRIVEFVRDQIAHTDAILFSDYRTGLLTPTLVDEIKTLSMEKGVLVTADAQGQLGKYHRVDLVKCNADEARGALDRALATDEDFADAAQTLREQLEIRGAMVITRGADGATLATASNEVHHHPAPRISDVFDTVGAGDTTIAVMTLARIAGATYNEAITLANYASGVVVQRVGNYAPSQADLIRAIEGD